VSSKSIAFSVAATISATVFVRAVFAQEPSPPTSTLPICVERPSTDNDLEAIVEEVFRNTPIRLLEAGLIDKDFYESIENAQFEICDDKNWDVVVLPRQPPMVVFDYDLLTLLTRASQTLLLSQYLARDDESIDELGLHTFFMRYVLAQNLRNAPVFALSQLVDEYVGKRLDIRKYIEDRGFKDRHEKLVLQSIYFLVFHEFCHIRAGDIRSRVEINRLTDETEKVARLVQLETTADSCAIEIINRDEAQHSSSPISFISAFTVASTQAVLERVLGDSREVTHPSPQARLTNAREKALKLIEGSPNATRYAASVNGLYQHFAGLVTE
jgi:hypothetical protein